MKTTSEASLSREPLDDPIVNTNWNAEHPVAALVAPRYRTSKDKDARLVLNFRITQEVETWRLSATCCTVRISVVADVGSNG